MTERRWLTIILVATTLLGWTYAVVNPVFEGGDELWHYPMVQHLSDFKPLPVQVFDPTEAGPWKQQASQPPLYYYVTAWLTAWINTSDMLDIRWQNPHVDNGIITPDGNINLTIHNPHWNPWNGTLLAVRIVRFVSVLMGVVTVYFTYRIGKFVAPERADIALGAAAVVGFLPMRLFVSAAVNNDNGIIILATIAVFLLIRYTQTPPQALFNKQLGMLGFIIGMACLTKIIGVGLLPLAFGALFLANWRARDTHTPVWRAILLGFGRTSLQTGVVFAVAFAIAGWWYIRNIQLYDDWRGWSAFIAVLGERNQPATLAQLWDERYGFMMAFWGLFGGVNVPLPLWIYDVLNAVMVIGVAGFVLYVGKITLRHFKSDAAPRVNAIPSRLLDFAAEQAPIVICLVWMLAVVVGLIDWATTTWSSQGRLVFGALQAEMVLLVVGLVGWTGERFGRIIVTTLAAFLLLVAASAPFAVIRPAYAIQTVNSSGNPPLTVFGDTIALDAISAEAPVTAAAGDRLDLCLNWRIVQPTDRNWSAFIHLNDPVLGNPIAQRDMYLAQGLLGTSFADPGTAVENCYALTIPQTAVAPANLSIDVGLYDAGNFERLLTSDGTDYYSVGNLSLTAPSNQLPNATQINFGNEIQLSGFAIAERRIVRGSGLNVTLFLEALQPLDTDYSITAQLVSQDLTDTTRWAAQDVALGSTSWQPGEQMQIDLALETNSATPAGVYRLIVGVYTQTDAGFSNLALVSADGRITNDNLLTLTKIRIDE